MPQRWGSAIEGQEAFAEAQTGAAALPRRLHLDTGHDPSHDVEAPTVEVQYPRRTQVHGVESDALVRHFDDDLLRPEIGAQLVRPWVADREGVLQYVAAPS